MADHASRGRKRASLSAPQQRNTRARRGSPPPERPRREDIPDNWTIAKLVTKLKQLNINVSAALGKKTLVQLWKDNATRTDAAVHASGAVGSDTGTDRPRDPMVAEPENGSLAQVVQQLRKLQDAVAEIRSSRATSAAPSTDSTHDSQDHAMNSTQPSFAVPMDSLPPVDLVPASVRRDIQTGKHVNLATLLIPGMDTPNETRIIDQGGSQIVVKANDPRLSKTLTISEFRKAFSKFKNVLCEAYPHRRKEMDTYCDLIEDLHQKYGGHTFYDYHNAFSRKAAQYLAQSNVLVDWSCRDTELFLTLFAGKQCDTCSRCGSALHATGFCQYQENATSRQDTHGKTQSANRHSNNSSTGSVLDRQGRSIVTQGGRQICNNFNDSVCRRNFCNFLHICKSCRAPHALKDCDKYNQTKGTTANTSSTKSNNN